MRTVTIALAFAFAVSGTAVASDKHGAYMVMGVGTKSCGSWLQDRQERSFAELNDRAWISGYVTAYNEYVWPKQDVVQGTDTDGLAAWIDNYCTAHPLSDLSHAAEALIIELKNRPHP
jgi:hypothetical protein